MFAAQDYLDKLESQQDLLRAVLQKVNLEIAPRVDQTNSVYSSKEMHIQVTINPATMLILKILDGRVDLQKALDKIELEGFVGSDIAKVVLNDIEMLIQLGMLVPQTPSRHPK